MTLAHVDNVASQVCSGHDRGPFLPMSAFFPELRPSYLGSLGSSGRSSVDSVDDLDVADESIRNDSFPHAAEESMKLAETLKRAQYLGMSKSVSHMVDALHVAEDHIRLGSIPQQALHLP